MGSSKSVQSHASCGVEKNPMGLWCRLFKCTQEGRAFEQKLQALMEKAVGHLEKAGKRMANELERPAGLSLWAQISIALAIAVTGSVLSICGSYWMFGRELSAQASVGRAVITVWSELEEKTKAKIEQEY